MSPVLKEKPVLGPKPPCGGCDFCGDLREDGLYLLGYKEKYYCVECFRKTAQGWPRPKAKTVVHRNFMSDEDVRDAYEKGLRRSRAARRRSGTHKYNWKPGDEQPEVDAQSAVAELLVARCTNRKWLSSGEVPDKPEDGDVEGGIQVRHTSYGTGSLIVHPEDNDQHKFVLVVGKDEYMRVVGYIDGHKAKSRNWWRSDVRYPAYFVPQSALNDIAELQVKQ